MTGVQTCALPICRIFSVFSPLSQPGKGEHGQEAGLWIEALTREFGPRTDRIQQAAADLGRRLAMPDTPTADCLQRLQDQAREMERRLQELDDVRQLQHGSDARRLTSQAFNLTEMLEACVNDCAAAAHERGITITLDHAAPAHYNVVGQREPTRQAVSRLLHLALQRCAAGPLLVRLPPPAAAGGDRPFGLTAVGTGPSRAAPETPSLDDALLDLLAAMAGAEVSRPEPDADAPAFALTLPLTPNQNAPLPPRQPQCGPRAAVIQIDDHGLEQMCRTHLTAWGVDCRQAPGRHEAAAGNAVVIAQGNAIDQALAQHRAAQGHRLICCAHADRHEPADGVVWMQPPYTPGALARTLEQLPAAVASTADGADDGDDGTGLSVGELAQAANMPEQVYTRLLQMFGRELDELANRIETALEQQDAEQLLQPLRKLGDNAGSLHLTALHDAARALAARGHHGRIHPAAPELEAFRRRVAATRELLAGLPR